MYQFWQASTVYQNDEKDFFFKETENTSRFSLVYVAVETRL